MANPFRAFSVLGLGAVVAGGIAWTSGELQRFGFASPLVQSAALVDAAPQAEKTELSNLTKAADAPANPAIDQAVLAPTRIPAFDIVRVQPDGSMVIAGRAAPGAAIDIIAGGRVIGQTSTDESGSFAFVLDQPLAPGDYDIGLVARVNGETLASEEKAIVQIPKTPGGDVLAIVTAPDTAPDVMAAGAVNAPIDQMANQVAVITETAPAKPDQTVAPVAEAAPATIVSADPAVPVAPTTNDLRIEAVEIDGAKTFIAGSAKAGSAVRLYLGETLLGEAKAGDEGRFLIESKQPVPVGTQILRADAVDAKGDVIARASVPFERVDDEKLALVAPAAKAQPATETAKTVAAPAAETVSVDAPALTKVDTSVIIRKGDTLWQIARRVYGKGVTFSTIFNANVAQITNPNRIFPGQVFAVPRNTEAGDAADFNGIADQKKEAVVVE
jgi:nucleoid-associated protein YgaU